MIVKVTFCFCFVIRPTINLTLCLTPVLLQYMQPVLSHVFHIFFLAFEVFQYNIYSLFRSLYSLQSISYACLLYYFDWFFVPKSYFWNNINCVLHTNILHLKLFRRFIDNSLHNNNNLSILLSRREMYKQYNLLNVQ